MPWYPVPRSASTSPPIAAPSPEGVGARWPSSPAVSIAPIPLPTARCFSLTEALAHLPQARVEAPLAQRLRQGQVTALAELRDAFGPVLPPPVAALAEADASPLSALTVIDPAGALVAIVDRGQANQSWRIARGF